MIKIFLGIALLLIVNQSCTNEKPVTPGGKALVELTMVEAFVVQPALLENLVVTHGSILPNEVVELRSETAGKITGIYFEEGKAVKRGALLVQMDDSELLPQLEKNKVQLLLAKKEFSRKSQLFEIKGISREELDNAELQVASLESEIGLLAARIRKMKIVAPFDGVVGLRDASQGAYLEAGRRIASLVQVNPAKIEFSVSEIAAAQIHAGVALEFRLAGSDVVHKATVYAMEPAIDQATRSLKVRALAENDGGGLIPGSFVELTVMLNEIPDGLLVPSIAVTQDIKGQKVFVVENGHAVSKAVETGIQKNELVQITQGINAGDTIITTALLSMQDGMPVAVKQPENSKKQ